MGPTYVLRKVRESKKVGHNHQYLKKVRKRYFKLVRYYLNFQNKRIREYRSSYVYLHKGSKSSRSKLAFIIPKMI